MEYYEDNNIKWTKKSLTNVIGLSKLIQMKNLIYLTMIFIVSCSQDYSNEVKIYQAKVNSQNNNEFIYYYNNELHSWKLSNSNYIGSFEEDSSSMIKDAVEIYNGSSLEISLDSIYVVTIMPGVSGGNGINFIACIKDDIFKTHVYFPNSKKGSYTFRLSKDEKRLFDFLLNNLNLTRFENLYLTKDTLHNSSAIYLKLFLNSESKYVFASIYESTKNIRILHNYLQILINEKINTRNLREKEQKFNCFYIENEFDSLVKRYKFTGLPLSYDTLIPPMPTF